MKSHALLLSASISQTATPTTASSAVVTVLPNNSTSYITASYTAQADGGAKSHARHYKLSSKVRATLVTQHSIHPGYNAITMSAAKKLRVAAILLPTPGIEDGINNNENEVYVATTSNDSAAGKLVLLPYDFLTGSTIRLVTTECANRLPLSFLRGTSFKHTTKNIDKAIKDLLPSKTQSYNIVLLPNPHPIKPGQPNAVRGSIDDTVLSLFKDEGEWAEHWIGLQTSTSKGAVPFDLAFQKAVHGNKASLGSIYPAHAGKITLTESPYVTFSQAPYENDDDLQIQPAIDEICEKLKAAYQRCLPPPPPQAMPTAPPQNVDTDLQSLAGAGNTSGGAADTQAQDRLVAKLRLLTASWTPEGGFVFFDLSDEILKVLALPKAQRPEAFINNIESTAKRLAQSLDCLNRSCNWPKDYRASP